MLNYGPIAPWFILYVWGILIFVLAGEYVTIKNNQEEYVVLIDLLANATQL